MRRNRFTNSHSGKSILFGNRTNVLLKIFLRTRGARGDVTGHWSMLPRHWAMATARSGCHPMNPPATDDDCVCRSCASRPAFRVGFRRRIYVVIIAAPVVHNAMIRREAGRSHPAPHVLLASGDAGSTGESDPGARWAPGPDDNAAVHASHAGCARVGDQVARWAA